MFAEGMFFISESVCDAMGPLATIVGDVICDIGIAAGTAVLYLFERGGNAVSAYGFMVIGVLNLGLECFYTYGADTALGYATLSPDASGARLYLEVLRLSLVMAFAVLPMYLLAWGMAGVWLFGAGLAPVVVASEACARLHNWNWGAGAHKKVA